MTELVEVRPMSRPECPSFKTLLPADQSRAQQKPSSNNAARERSRVRALRAAFLQLQQCLPAVPPDTKLSKLDVLVLATAYICHLTQSLQKTRHAITRQKDDMDNQRMQANSQRSQSQIVNTVKGGDNDLTALCLTLPQRKLLASPINDSQTKDFAAEKKRQKYCGLNNSCLDPAVGHKRTFEKKKMIEKNITHYHSIDTCDRKLRAQLSKVKLEVSSHPSLNKVSPIFARNMKSFNSTVMATLRPVKKWPMRSRLYESLLGSAEVVSTSSSKALLQTKCT